MYPVKLFPVVRVLHPFYVGMFNDDKFRHLLHITTLANARYYLSRGLESVGPGQGIIYYMRKLFHLPPRSIPAGRNTTDS